jgi:AraC-like DNA-binding protein
VSALVLESILLNALASAARSRTPRGLRRPPWLVRAKELLHDRALEAPRLDDIARTVGVHPGHLSREFRRFFGVVPGEYLRQLRVDHAARQLAETDAPMLEIALGAGFADQAHFARAFRRAMGHSPASPGALSGVAVLVTFATTAGSPVATRAGNVIRLPPPAIALTAPAASAAPAAGPNRASSLIRGRMLAQDDALRLARQVTAARHGENVRS